MIGNEFLFICTDDNCVFISLSIPILFIVFGAVISARNSLMRETETEGMYSLEQSEKKRVVDVVRFGCKCAVCIICSGKHAMEMIVKRSGDSARSGGDSSTECQQYELK